MVRNERIKRILIQSDEANCKSGVLVGIKKINSDGMARIFGVPFPLPAGVLFGPGGDDVHATEIPRSDKFRKIFALVSSGKSGG
jgi:hypothetical protein